MAKKPNITPFRLELLRRAKHGLRPQNTKEANSAERLEQAGLLVYTPGYGAPYQITKAGLAILEKAGKRRL